MKLLIAIFLTSFGTLTAKDTPELFQAAEKIYHAAKLSQSEKNYQESAQLFKSAEELYQKFITENPDHPEVATAYYRSGVSDLLAGKRSNAEEAFQNTLKASKNTGPFAASAAFRLGALTYNDKEYADATPYFLISKNETDKPHLEANSLNYLARCYLFTKQNEEAQTALEELVAFNQKEKKFSPQAHLALGHLHQEKGELSKAAKYYLAVPKSKDPTVTDPQTYNIAAGVAGLSLASELAKEDSDKGEALQKSSIQLLQEGLDAEDPKGLQLWAQFALMTHYANHDRHAQVLAVFNKGSFPTPSPSSYALIHPEEVPQDLTAKVLLLAASSSFEEGNFESTRILCNEVADATEDETLLNEATELKEKAREQLQATDQ